MSRDPRAQRIDWVVPPFAGHAYPALMVAARLQTMGFTGLRILSTPSLGRAATELGLPFVSMMAGREDDVLAIANTKARGPRAMLRQFRATLGVLEGLGEELTQTWSRTPPDLVIADSVLPSAGLSARALGIDWWTSMASLAPTETRTGTPAYLRGWGGHRDRPNDSWRGLRDRAGRAGTRLFKKSAAWLGRRQLRRLGLHSIYRRDGTEAFYSDQCILGFGSKTFEFHRDWPAAMQFVGPVFGSPHQGGAAPVLEAGSTHVLVTLGTHLHWAKARALELVRELAQQRPEWTFHFSRGESGSTTVDVEGNLHVHAYIPYGNLDGFRLALVHGGAGIVYACLAHGIPMVVWPHDYDQFDNAARVSATGAGVRAKGTIQSLLAALARVTSGAEFLLAAERMRSELAPEDPARVVAALLLTRTLGT